MFNLRGIAGDSPFSIQQEAELMIGHVISHGCLNGTFRRIGITRFHHFTVNGMVAAPEEISTSEPSSLFFITLPASSKGPQRRRLPAHQLHGFKIIAVRGIGNTAKSDAGDTVATFFRGRAIS